MEEDKLWKKIKINNHPDLYPNLFKLQKIKSWNDIIKFYNMLKDDGRKTWLFRGQENPGWGLMTAIERFSLNSLDRKEEAYKQLPVIEDELIRRFKRHFHQYSQYIPDEKDTVEWLSYMQHYGTATRFLDCTYSFYVALFFAIESAIKVINKNNYRAVWAFDAAWIHDRGKAKLTPEVIKKYNIGKFSNAVTDSKRDNDLLFNKKPKTSIQSVNPFKLNERLIIQQGVFLAPRNLKKSFIENLAALPEDEKEDPKEHLYLLLLPNDKQFMKETIYELYRMNMNSATLFPGLEGFARNLNRVILFPELVKISKKQKALRPTNPHSIDTTN